MLEAIIAELERQAKASREKYPGVVGDCLYVCIVYYDVDGRESDRPFAEIDGGSIDLGALVDAIKASRALD